MAAAATLAELADRGVLSGVVARERTLPVLPAFASLLPRSVLQRGSIVACEGSAAASLALALAAGPSQEGAWIAVAGFPDVGVAAAAELGVVPARLVMVAEPTGNSTTGFDDAKWADVLAAMIDGFDVLLLGPGTMRVRAGTARRLVARAQARGVVIISIGANAGFAGDLRFEVTQVVWQGLGEGYGVASNRYAHVQLTGRRVPRPRRAELWLPNAEGRVSEITSQSVVALCPTG